MGSPRLTLEDLGLAASKRKQLLHSVGAVVLAAWKAEARARLRGKMALAYQQALGIRQCTEARVVVALPARDTDSNPKRAVLARMAEFGMGPGGIGTQGPYDARKFVLKSGTPYVNVPFDFSSGQIGSRFGKDAAKEARQLKATIALEIAGQRVKTWWGGRFGAGRVGKGQDWHKTDPLAGLVRLQSTYSLDPKTGKARVQDTGYRTWRRMSWTGAPWMVPGIPAANIAEHIQESLMPALVETALSVWQETL